MVAFPANSSLLPMKANTTSATYLATAWSTTLSLSLSMMAARTGVSRLISSSLMSVTLISLLLVAISTKVSFSRE